MDKGKPDRRRLLRIGAVAGALAVALAFLLLLPASLPLWSGALPAAAALPVAATALFLSSLAAQLWFGAGLSEGALLRGASGFFSAAALLLLLRIGLPGPQSALASLLPALLACLAGNITGSILRLPLRGKGPKGRRKYNK